MQYRKENLYLMNERPSLPRSYDGQDSADPETRREDLLKNFPVYAFESEFQRSLDMIALCQRYLSHLAEDEDRPEADEIRQSLSDIAVAATRLDRNLNSLTALLRCAQQSEAPQWEPVELCTFVRTLCAEQDQLQKELDIRLSLDCGGLDELVVQADRRYLSRIGLHLLSNAVRACAPGGGRIVCACARAARAKPSFPSPTPAAACRTTRCAASSRTAPTFWAPPKAASCSAGNTAV